MRAEMHIRTIGKVITKHLTGKGEMWPIFAAVVAARSIQFRISLIRTVS